MKSIPGWTAAVDENHSEALKVILTDKSGRKVEVIGAGRDETLEKALNAAFDIQKEVVTGWSRFLYDLCCSELADSAITRQIYYDNAFGSWIIEVRDSRILYDGRDFWIITQFREGNDWIGKTILKKEELSYTTLMRAVNSIK